MLCQECQKRPATIHFTKIINGEKTEFHLCEQCAQENGQMMMFTQLPGLSFNNFLAGLFNKNSGYPQEKKEVDPSHDLLQCSTCGLTFNQFLKIGKFGCPNCYDAFADQLTPIFRRLHGGNWKHNGKIPQRAGGSLFLKRKIERLKETLQVLVANEEFEKAAEVRDEIRKYEKQLQEGGR